MIQSNIGWIRDIKVPVNFTEMPLLYKKHLAYLCWQDRALLVSKTITCSNVMTQRVICLQMKYKYVSAGSSPQNVTLRLSPETVALKREINQNPDKYYCLLLASSSILNCTAMINHLYELLDKSPACGVKLNSQQRARGDALILIKT